MTASNKGNRKYNPIDEIKINNIILKNINGNRLYKIVVFNKIYALVFV